MEMKIVALAGGVGGAKLVHGLAQVLAPEDLNIVVNTGDDFEHLGLYICPDLDTVCYTLAGLANLETGWGRANETWTTITKIVELGGPGWFRLGDLDLGTHIERTRRMRSGQSLSQIVNSFCETWKITSALHPMSDDRIRTKVSTREYGQLDFQEYFVKYNCSPKVTGFQFQNIENSQPAPGVIEAIKVAQAVVICPSNPWVSIDPILDVRGIRASMNEKIVVAVSPIIAGKAVKGPAAKMYTELGYTPSALSVAKHYRELITGFVMDKLDESLRSEIENLDLHVLTTNTLMTNVKNRIHLAEDVLNFIGSLI
jgi:LPPG:FO 2-phospho-L-lactate transferase